MFTHTCVEMSLIVSVYTVRSYEGRVKRYFRRISLSLSVLLVWQLAQGSSPSLCFCPSAHSALPKAQCSSSSSTTQSWQTPTGGRQVCISARQLSLQQSRAEWQWMETFFHTLPKTASYSIADTLKPKIGRRFFFFCYSHLQRCNDFVWSQSVQISYCTLHRLSWILKRLNTATCWEIRMDVNAFSLMRHVSRYWQQLFSFHIYQPRNIVKINDESNI